MLRTYQWLLIIFVASFSVLTAFWIIKTIQVKERSKEENRVKKTEDSSCSLPSHFWSTSRSKFSTCYIPFQSSGSQESNALNCVRFGAKMRKIWPSEDNCIKQVRISHNSRSKCEFRTTNHACANFAQQPMHVRISHNSPSKCKFCTTTHACTNFAQQPMHVRILHQPMRLWCEISSVLPTPHEIFSFEDNAQLGWGVWGRKYSKSFWYCNYIG